MAWYKDTGYRGVITSLGGIKSKPGTGLEVEPFGFTTSGVPGGMLREPNPKRVNLLIQNSSSSYYCRIGLGTADIYVLYPGAAFVIDALMPWTGAVWCSSGDGDATLACFESQIQVT